VHAVPENLVVIGASAGGITAISKIINELPGTLKAAVMAVVHMSINSNANNLARFFQKQTSLNCIVPADREKIKNGTFYLAPANHHMMVKDGIITINRGAKENRYRPSIDVLFRSAAVNYGSGVTGIILSGMLDDGTSGMSAIKRCGGICIVQDPSDAEFSDMPQSVINQIEVDYKIKLGEIASLLHELLAEPVSGNVPVPEELKIEAEITENMMTSINQMNEIGEKSDFSCPDCGGSLYAVKNDPSHRYRCHTGHVYTENLLYELKGNNLEESVWVSVRILEEKRNILKLMAVHSDDEGRPGVAAEQRKQAEEIEKHIEGMKLLLQKLTTDLKERNADTRA
jgi:two-component system, chemotaxis family, protein-glutamate methylesterase/glutaminase